ncbi:MAG: hypothetical protein ABIH82_04590 [Candidatus Woesearchaeota archaeon]
MVKKEFDYHFAEMGDFFTTHWTAKKLVFHKEHNKTIKEELRLENLTGNKLTITIEDHEILQHPQKVNLKPKEVKHITIKVPCKVIKGKHSSNLVLNSKNQISKVPIRITHSE